MNRTHSPLPSIAETISGHLTIGLIKGLGALVLMWGCTWFVKIDADFGQLFWALVISGCFSEIVAAMIERPFVLKSHRANPGGVAFVLLPFIVSTLISFVISYAMTQSFKASLLIACVVSGVNAIEVIGTRSWEQGENPEEVAKKIEEVREMTQEHFAEDVAEIKRRARERTKQKYYAKKARNEAKERKDRSAGQ